jgi:hypothetical protein
VDFDSPPLPGDFVYIKRLMYVVAGRFHRLGEREMPHEILGGKVMKRSHQLFVGLRLVADNRGVFDQPAKMEN